MDKFINHTGLAVPLYRPNIDTDQIIPKQFLKSIRRTGFGASLFYDWRFLNGGEPNPEFVLNDPKYAGVSILLTGRNFGCGSSREHAPWALAEYGFRSIIAPSFADIFYNNSIKTGLLPVIMAEDRVAELVEKCERSEGYRISIDLESREVRDDSGFVEEFSIDEFSRHCLINGLDNIALTLQQEEKINVFEANDKNARRLGVQYRQNQY